MTQLNRILFIVSIVMIFIYLFRLLGTELNVRKVYKCLDKELVEITKGLKLCESINLLKHSMKHKYEDNQTVISKTDLPKRYLNVTSKIDSAHMLFGKYVTHTSLYFDMIRVESDYMV